MRMKRQQMRDEETVDEDEETVGEDEELVDEDEYEDGRRG